MKKQLILSLLILAFVPFTLHAQQAAQPLPLSAHVAPYKLTIGLNTTTVLIFPAAVINGDRGSTDIMLQKEAGVENVLKLKGSKKNFPATNLHVYTADRRIYSFTVEYADTPGQLTYDLANLENSWVKKSSLLPDVPLTQAELQVLAKTAREAQPFIRKRQRQQGMSLAVRSVFTANDVHLFCFALSNHSALPYTPGSVRLYLKDKHRNKRSSVQEQEMIPVYMDPLQELKGKSEVAFVVAVPRFTVAKEKKFYVEVMEQNGGRHFSLQIGNGELLKAKAF